MKRFAAVLLCCLIFLSGYPFAASAATEVPATDEITIIDYFMNEVGQGLSAVDVANKLVGTGVEISNVQSNCADRAAGTFTVTGDVGIGFSSGIILSSGTIDNVLGPNDKSNATVSNNKDGDTDLDALITGYMTHDACSIEFDFTTDSSAASFKYVFASEEYNEFVNTSFNDVFGFFIDGVNCATIGESNVSINNVNAGFNDDYYVNNDTGAFNNQMDGLTQVMTCSTAIQPGQTHHLKLAIADAGDSILDSNVFIEMGSLTSSEYGVMLSPSTMSKGAATGTVATFMLDLTNLGSKDDTFKLTLFDSEWNAVFARNGKKTLTVGPMSSLFSAKVMVNVLVPDNPVQTSSKVAVTATSVGDPSMSYTSYLTTKLSPINLSMDQVAVDGCPKVTAYVTVVDQSGIPIAGLASTDFTVKEDGKARTPVIATTVSGNSDMSIGMTLDYSSSMFTSSSITPLESAATSFANQFGSSDALEIVKFSTVVETVQGFTTNKSLLSAAVTGIWSGANTDAAAFYDAVFKTVTDTSARTGRKMVIAMADGFDNGSTHTIEQLITYANALGIPIYTVGLGSTNTWPLMYLATATGGRYYYASTGADLTGIYAKIATAFKSQYAINYPSGFTDGAQHTVKVVVTKDSASSNGSKTFPGCSGNTGSIIGTVVNATTNQEITGASITLSGTSNYTATTNGTGSFSFNGLAAGGYSLQVSAGGFTSDVRIVNVAPSGTTVVIALSPVMISTDYRAVLSWGAGPKNLDLYAFVPSGSSCSAISPANRGSLASSPFAFLDVDDTYSYGPETITVKPQQGTYQFWVYNQSGEGGGDLDITASAATVRLYKGSALVRTFDISSTPAGKLGWHVFDLNPLLGEINTINVLAPQINGFCTLATDRLAVIYDGNDSTGGTVPVDSTTYLAGENVTTLANSGNLVKAGYSFAGWNTADDGSGTNYTAGDTFTMGGSMVRLYAAWVPLPTYAVTYIGNGNTGGKVPVDGKRYYEGAAVTVLDNTGHLTRYGYKFAGWNTAADGSGTTYAAGASAIMGGGRLILYTYWETLPTYGVTYNGNGNTGGLAPIDGSGYHEGAIIIVLGNARGLARTGYTFAGWNTAPDGSGTSYPAGSTFTIGAADVALFARWVQSHSVTYHGNGNTGGTVPLGSTTFVEGTSVMVLGNAGMLVRTGSAFVGWNTAADESGTSYTPGATITIGATDIALYAVWRPSHTVTYSGNGNIGGTVPLGTTTYVEGAMVTVLGNSGGLTRAGYVFDGWNSAPDGGTAHIPGDTFVMGAANVTLYAKWVSSYLVIYKGNGNTGGFVPVASTAYGKGSTVTVLGNTGALSRTGYAFAGWNTAADRSGTNYAAGATFPMDSVNVTLFAMWDPSHSVTYSGNGNTGGTVPVDSTSYPENGAVQILGNTTGLVRTGYTFAGWNTAADGSGTPYVAGTTLVMGAANVVLYADWTPLPTYSVTYSGNGSTGGTEPVDNTTYLQGAIVAIHGNTGTLVRTGHVFAGWNTAADGSGPSYNAGATFAMGSANVTLYAKWVPSYTVTYSGNGNAGGTVPVDGNRYVEGGTVTVLGNTANLTRTGYAFAGWNTAANGSGTTFGAGATFAMGAADVKLYAIWLPSYAVTYSSNGSSGGSVPVDGNRYLQGATVTILGNTGNLAKAGYAFTGWNTAANGSGTTYAAGATFTTGTGNVTMYAMWVPTYVVAYSGNGSTGGSVPVDSTRYVQGATVTVLGNTGTLARTGYAFAGWNTAANGSGTSYAAGATFAMGTAKVNLYAQWTSDPTGPALVISTLADGTRTNNSILGMNGTVTDAGGIKSLTVKGVAVTVGTNGTFSYAVTLTSGSNLITTIATDYANNKTTDTRTIIFDGVAPVVTVTTPEDASIARQATLSITGTVNETSIVTVKVNAGSSEPVTMAGNGFSATVTLPSGSNSIEITATDQAGNPTRVTRTVVYDNTSPALAITDPAQDITTAQNTMTIKGTVSDSLSRVSVKVKVDGQTFTPTVMGEGFQQQVVFTTAKQYLVTVTATDEAGNSVSVVRTVTYAPAAATLAGDTTGDGKVDVLDALLTLQYALDLIPHDAPNNEKYLAVADLYPLDPNQKPKGDNMVDVMDALLILQRAVNLVTW